MKIFEQNVESEIKTETEGHNKGKIVEKVQKRNTPTNAENTHNHQ